MSNALPKTVVQIAGLKPPPSVATAVSVTNIGNSSNGDDEVPSNTSNNIAAAAPFTQPSVPSKRSQKSQEQANHHAAITTTLLAATDTLSTLRDKILVGHQKNVIDLTQDVDVKELQALKKQKLTGELMDADLKSLRESINDTTTFTLLDESVQNDIKTAYSNVLAAKANNALQRVKKLNDNKSTSSGNMPSSSRRPLRTPQVSNESTSTPLYVDDDQHSLSSNIFQNVDYDDSLNDDIAN